MKLLHDESTKLNRLSFFEALYIYIFKSPTYLRDVNAHLLTNLVFVSHIFSITTAHNSTGQCKASVSKRPERYDLISAQWSFIRAYGLTVC